MQATRFLWKTTHIEYWSSHWIYKEETPLKEAHKENNKNGCNLKNIGQGDLNFDKPMTRIIGAYMYV